MPVHKADSYCPAMPEIPPGPPFLKGGDFRESLPNGNLLTKIHRVCNLVLQIRIKNLTILIAIRAFEELFSIRVQIGFAEICVYLYYCFAKSLNFVRHFS